MSGRDPLPREQAYEGVKAVNPPDIIPAKRAPLPSDFKYPLGTMWINTVTGISYQLIRDPGVWAILGVASGGALNALTDQLGFVALPAGGQIAIKGGTNITTSAVGNEIDISTIANPVFGSVTTPGNVTSTAGDLVTVAPNAQLALEGSGSHIAIKGGAANDFIGSATLGAGGTVTILKTNITVNDFIFIQRRTNGGTLGNLSYSIVPGASFTISSTSAAETSTVVYLIVRLIP